MFASGQNKPLCWVGVIAVEFISICSIPNGLGVEWSSMTYEEAVYESEPDDGFRIYPDGQDSVGDDDKSDCDNINQMGVVVT